MSISNVGYATNNAATTITIPGTYQIGDLAIILAFNDASTTAPTLPAGWTSYGTTGTNVTATRLGWKLLTSNSDVSGTWTNATSLACAVYRGTTTRQNPISTYNTNSQTNSNNNTNVIYQAMSVPAMQQAGNSWVVAMAAIKSIDTTIATPPTGLTNQSSSTGVTDEIVIHDSGSPLSSFGNAGNNITVAVGGTAAAWVTWTVEILADYGGIKVNRGLRPHPFSPGLAR